MSVCVRMRARVYELRLENEVQIDRVSLDISL